MDHTVTIVQIRPVCNPSKIIANVDVKIDDILVRNFKIIRNTDGACWVSNPQVEVGPLQFIDSLTFLDVELESKVKSMIKDTYLKNYQPATLSTKSTKKGFLNSTISGRESTKDRRDEEEVDTLPSAARCTAKMPGLSLEEMLEASTKDLKETDVTPSNRRPL